MANKKVKKLASFFDLPKEIVLDYPYISLVGHEELNIQNYKSLLEYSQNRIRISTTTGAIKIEGSGLQIKYITAENVKIKGIIQNVDLGGGLC